MSFLNVDLNTNENNSIKESEINDFKPRVYLNNTGVYSCSITSAVVFERPQGNAGYSISISGTATNVVGDTEKEYSFSARLLTHNKDGSINNTYKNLLVLIGLYNTQTKQFLPVATEQAVSSTSNAQYTRVKSFEDFGAKHKIIFKLSFFNYQEKDGKPNFFINDVMSNKTRQTAFEYINGQQAEHINKLISNIEAPSKPDIVYKQHEGFGYYDENDHFISTRPAPNNSPRASIANVQRNTMNYGGMMQNNAVQGNVQSELYGNNNHAQLERFSN